MAFPTTRCVRTTALQGVGPYGEAKIQAEGLCLEFRR
jgi:hypothetical protein